MRTVVFSVLLAICLHPAGTLGQLNSGGTNSSTDIMPSNPSALMEKANEMFSAELARSSGKYRARHSENH
jgi:hypothetical protein